MKKQIEHRNHEDMRPEYDFAAMSGGVRGKHYGKYRKGTNVVLLTPEIVKAFPTEEAVNEALRGILRTARAVRKNGGLADRALGATAPAPRRTRRRG